MVYRGHLGAESRKKGRRCLSIWFVLSTILIVSAGQYNVWAGSLCSRRRKHIWDLGACSPQIRRIRLTDVLGRSPATDVLDVRYHRSPDDTCEAGPAPIISNPGDNHAPGGISTSRTPKMGVRTPILGVPGALRAPAGGARTPGGGSKIIPPG